MNPIGQPVTGVDLGKIRQQNEDSLQTRATQQLGAEVKAAATNSTASKVEKEAAGDDRFEAVVEKPAPQARAAKSAAPQNSASTGSSSSAAECSNSASTSSVKADENGSCPPDNGGSTPPPGNGGPDYTEGEKQFLLRMEEMEKQAAEQRKMWRQVFKDWYDSLLKWKEDLENFAQATYLLWHDIAIGRSVQMAKQSEAVRALL